MNYTSLKVGQSYPGRIIPEGTLLDYDSSGFLLRIFLPHITEEEQRGLQAGRYRIALTDRKGILFFLSEFKPGINLSDTPFHFGLYEDREERAKYLPNIDQDGKGIALTVIAVDTADNIVKSLRLIGLSTALSRKLIGICKQQAAETIDRDQYFVKLKQIQQQYTAKQLYRYSIIECRG